jgi:hypothetical protein
MATASKNELQRRNSVTATATATGTPDTTSLYFRGGAKEACLFRASLSQAR